MGLGDNSRYRPWCFFAVSFDFSLSFPVCVTDQCVLPAVSAFPSPGFLFLSPPTIMNRSEEFARVLTIILPDAMRDRSNGPTTRTSLLPQRRESCARSTTSEQGSSNTQGGSQKIGFTTVSETAAATQIGSLPCIAAVTRALSRKPCLAHVLCDNQNGFVLSCSRTRMRTNPLHCHRESHAEGQVSQKKAVSRSKRRFWTRLTCRWSPSQARSPKTACLGLSSGGGCPRSPGVSLFPSLSFSPTNPEQQLETHSRSAKNRSLRADHSSATCTPSSLYPYSFTAANSQ